MAPVADSNYRRIAADLAARIEDGTYAPGDALPAQRALAAEHDVSLATVTAAIGELQVRGLAYHRGGRVIVRSRGRTNFYATDELRPDRENPDQDAFSENARKTGHQPGKRFRMLMEVPPVDVARRLGVGADTVVVVRISHQLLDGEPWSRETSYYPRDLAEEVGVDTPYDIERGTIRILAEMGHLEIAHRDEITDEPASPEDAADLAVPVGSPLLVQTRTAASADRITRVTRYVRLGGRNRLIWETGDKHGLDTIRRAAEPETS